MEVHIAFLAITAYVIYWLFLRIPNYQQAEDVVIQVVVFFLFIGLIQFCVYYLTGVILGYDGEYDLGGGSKVLFYSWSAEPGLGVAAMEDAPWFRAASLFRESVCLGMLGTWFFAVSIFRFLSRPEKTWLWRLLLAGAIVIISASRAAMLACLVSVVTTIFFLAPRQRLRTLLMTLVLLLAIFSTGLMVGHGVGELFQGRLDESYAEKDIRWIMYLAQIEGFLQHPLMGNSPGSTEALIRMTVPETWEPETIPTGGYSTFLTLLHDEGLVGLGLFLAFIFKIFQEAKKISTMNQFGLPPRGISFFNGLLAMLVWSIFSPGLGMGLFWFGVALAWAFIQKDCLLLETCRSQEEPHLEDSHDRRPGHPGTVVLRPSAM